MPIQPEAVRTGLTATSTQLTPESGPNTTTEDNQLRTGVNAFGKMLGQAANFAKKRQVAQDIRTAENAALREEAMPGGLLPIAIDSYNNIVETNTANRFLSEFELIREGAERKSLITDSKKTTDEKNNIIDNSAEDFFARSAPFITNPEIREKLRTQLNVGRLADKKDILEVEDIQKKLVVIEGMRNQLSDEILLQNEEVSGAGLNIGADFLNKMAENATLAHPNIDSQEAKLLAFKIFMQNDDVLSNPQLVTNVLLKEIGKGFVGANLYHSNSKEGKAFKTEVDQFYRENERRETQLDKDNKDALTARISNYNITLAEQLANPDVSRKALLAQLKENTWLGAKAQAGFKTLIENYDDPIELSYDSPEGKKFLNQISSGEIKTKAQVKYQAAMLGFSIKNFDSSLPGMLVNIEVEERTAAKKHIERSLKVVRGGMVSTINAALSEYGFTNPGLAFDGKKKDEDALYKIIGILSAKGKPKEAKKVQEMYLAIQKFENTMDSRVAKIIQQAAARNIETTSPEMAEAVDRFLNDYETGMDKFILNVKKGIDPGEALTKEKTKVPSTESSTTSSSTSQKKPKIDAMEIFNASALRKEEKITLVETIAEEVAEEEFSRVSRLSTASKVKIDPSATVLSPADKKRLIKENEGFLRGVTQPDQTQPSAWERIQKAGDFLGETGDSMFNAGLDFMRSHTQPDPPESKSFRERTEENERQVDGAVLAKQRKESIELFKPFVGKGLSEPMSDEVRSQALADNLRNLEQLDQTISAGTKSRKNDGGMAGGFNQELTDEQEDLIKSISFSESGMRSDKLDKNEIKVTNDLYDNFTPATAAKYGAVRYNDSDKDEQTKWEFSAKNGIDAYNNGELTGDKKTNVDNLVAALDKHKQSYINDLNKIGLSYDEFEQLMIGTYAAETTFGTLALVSGKDVVGQLQVTRETLTDMWKRPNTPFGPNVAKSLKSSTNKTLKELKALSNAKLRALLLNNDEFNFMSGAMIMINKLQSRKMKLR